VEGAGAAGVAAALAEKELNHGKRIGIVITGGNVDMDQYAQVLAGEL
jgi:threonine dehydratase